jgi:hypothetical protein
MEDRFLELLKIIRIAAKEQELKDFTFEEIEVKTRISKEELKSFFGSEESLVEKVLDHERNKFMEIFDEYDFEGVNAIDILLTVSREMAKKFLLLNPSPTFDLKDRFPKAYQQHFEKRIQFIFEKIQINITKGINQRIYREDLSIELIARLYISRLIDLHNPDFFPPEKFSFEMLFDVMFDSFVRSIATPEGIKHYEKRRKSLKFEVDKI